MKTLLLALSKGTELIQKTIIILAILLMMLNSVSNAIGRFSYPMVVPLVVATLVGLVHFSDRATASFSFILVGAGQAFSW